MSSKNSYDDVGNTTDTTTMNESYVSNQSDQSNDTTHYTNQIYTTHIRNVCIISTNPSFSSTL